MKERVKKNIGKVVLVFSKDNFRFEGKLTNFDDDFFEILEFKTNCFRLMRYTEIKEMEIKNDSND